MIRFLGSPGSAKFSGMGMNPVSAPFLIDVSPLIVDKLGVLMPVQAKVSIKPNREVNCYTEHGQRGPHFFTILDIIITNHQEESSSPQHDKSKSS